MQENFEYVQRGFRILLPAMSGYIGKIMSRMYGDRWWARVYSDILGDQRDIPSSGEYGELVDSLDIANCIRILDRDFKDTFRTDLDFNCRTWAKELMGIRNIVAHIGNQDLDQPMAERALNTMYLLCKEIDADSAEELWDVYTEVRSKAGDAPAVYMGLAQPETDSKRGPLADGSLLQMIGTDMVRKTTITRKVTYGGKTVVYPVYQVRLDALYYNDSNDRISTWITRYEAENGQEGLADLQTDIYNRIIENFIFESNPKAIRRTQKNIADFGQREPGVTLADGRIVDGNRRFTCLRRIQRERADPVYFETVIMDMDIQADKKQIKLLELAIQHGEEKKEEYDPIDYAVGTYRDIVLSKLLTVQEYAAGTNESQADVRKRLDIAEITTEFLEYIKLPGQYHVAREYGVYDFFKEMLVPLHQIPEQERATLKEIAFRNAMTHAFADQRKFIRDIRSLVKNGSYGAYFEEQQMLAQEVMPRFEQAEIHGKEDIDHFAQENAPVVQQMQVSLERALQKTRAQILKKRPSENAEQAISLLMDIDPRLFSRLDPDEKAALRSDIDELIRLAQSFLADL